MTLKPPEKEESQITGDVTTRFETQVEELVNEDGTVGDTGATQEELDDLEAAMQGEYDVDEIVPDADPPPTETEKTPPPKGEDEKKVEEEKTEEGEDEKAGQDLLDALGETPETTVDFQPFELKYKADGEDKTAEIKTIAQIEQAFSKADGLTSTLEAKNVIIQDLTERNKTERERNERNSQAFKRTDFQMKKIQPFIDIVCKDSAFRDRMLRDKLIGPKLKEAGMTQESVDYDYTLAGEKADLAATQEGFDNRDIDTMSDTTIREFIKMRGLPAEELNIIIEMSKGTEDFVELRDENGRLKPLEDQKKHWLNALNKNYGLLVADGKIKPRSTAEAEKKAGDANAEVDALKKINQDHRTPPGAAGASKAGTQTKLVRRDDESDMDWNERWLREDPEGAKKLQQALTRW